MPHDPTNLAIFRTPICGGKALPWRPKIYRRQLLEHLLMSRQAEQGSEMNLVGGMGDLGPVQMLLRVSRQRAVLLLLLRLELLLPQTHSR
jgi:hypothetical protein